MVDISCTLVSGCRTQNSLSEASTWQPNQFEQPTSHFLQPKSSISNFQTLKEAENELKLHKGTVIIASNIKAQSVSDVVPRLITLWFATF